MMQHMCVLNVLTAAIEQNSSVVLHVLCNKLLSVRHVPSVMHCPSTAVSLTIAVCDAK